MRLQHPRTARTHTLAPDSPAVYPAAGVHSDAFTSHHCDLLWRTEEEEEAQVCVCVCVRLRACAVAHRADDLLPGSDGVRTRLFEDDDFITF